MPSPSAPSPTLTGASKNSSGGGLNRGNCESPKSPHQSMNNNGNSNNNNAASPTLSTHSSSSSSHPHHPHQLLSHHLHQQQQSIPISAAQQQSLLQTLSYNSSSSSTPGGGHHPHHHHHHQLSGLFGDLTGASLPSPSRAESCNVVLSQQRVSPSSLHLHQAAAAAAKGGENGGKGEKSTSSQFGLDSTNSLASRATPTTTSPASSGGNHHSHHHHQTSATTTSTTTTPHLPKAALTAGANGGGGGGRASDLNPDEMTDLEELEQFAKTFKQRRIKLGKCVMCCLLVCVLYLAWSTAGEDRRKQNKKAFQSLSRLSHAKQPEREKYSIFQTLQPQKNNHYLF